MKPREVVEEPFTPQDVNAFFVTFLLCVIFAGLGWSVIGFLTGHGWSRAWFEDGVICIGLVPGAVIASTMPFHRSKQ